MSRRGGVLVRRCVQEGCTENGHWAYESQREGNEMARSPYYRDWRCVRHTNPDKVLGPDNPARQIVLVCTEKFRTRPNYRTGQDETRSIGKFWVPQENPDGSGSGFNFSEAHKAFADDFPVGTRLVITAYVETPEQAEIARQVDAEEAS